MRTVGIIVNTKDRVEEGTNKISTSLAKKISSEKYTISLNDTKADVINIHSAGFFDARKKKDYPSHKFVFSFYGMGKCSYYPFLKSLLEYMIHFRDKDYDHRTILKRIVWFIIGSISYFVPLSLKRKYLKKCDKLIVGLECVQKQIKLPASVIRLGIDTHKFQQKNRTQGKIRVAYVGHNAPIKGLKDAIDAFGILKEEDFSFNVYLSDYSKNTLKYAKKVNKNILVHGRSDDIVQTYSDIDIIVLPFRSENAGVIAPLVLLEAMSCKKAIITTTLPNIKEICQNSVEYVDTFSAPQIARAIQKLSLSPSLREQLGERARKIIEEKYTLEKMLEEYKKMFTDLVEK